ncbi:major capsid protein [Methylocystis hirsuta]|uniref:Major capsid protein n=1 Tax=Methylocystis hirsuta TaxID=369798 RepID=A0A3M9XR32_9HYPH|nr:major capsid protein [Methylocystis hirsuta]RNJ49370.1 major capsid protein [Methylocystis hirsuta]
MEPTISRYETWELDALITNIERPNPWMLRTFFGREKLFTSRTVEFDVVDHNERRLAPFVSPHVSGTPTRRDGYHTKSLSPAYIKPFDTVQPSESYDRMPGEPYGGQLTPKQRFDRLVTGTLDRHIMMIDNTLEWMAAQALVYGAITIKGEAYPAVRVDFQRDASLNIDILGAAQWTKPTSNPLQNIEDASILTRRISKGSVIDTLLMDGATWQLLKQHATVQDLLDDRFRRHLPGQTLTAIDMAPRNNIYEAQWVGTIGGRFNVWVYDAFYQDDNGNDLPFIPPYTVLGIASGQLEGTQYFGGIFDIGANLEARKTFSKSWITENPSGLNVLTQSAPLVAPKRPNAMFKLRVA